MPPVLPPHPLLGVELRQAVDAVGGLEAYSRLQPLDLLPPGLDSKVSETTLWEEVYREESRPRGSPLCGG
jgi:hypothetical protein